MFSLTLALRDNPAIWVLMFKTKESALIAQEALVKSTDIEGANFSDDFGQTIMLWPQAIAGAVMEDLELSKLAHIERALHDARTRAKANSMAQADPILRAAVMTQGPAVLAPGMNGGGYPR